MSCHLFVQLLKLYTRMRHCDATVQKIAGQNGQKSMLAYKLQNLDVAGLPGISGKLHYRYYMSFLGGISQIYSEKFKSWF